VINRPAAFDCVELNDVLLSAVATLHPQWIYFGTLAQSLEQGEQRLMRLLRENPGAQCFYDVNLRDGHWNLALVQRLSKSASIIKLNEAEAAKLFELSAPSTSFSIDVFCRFWSSHYGGEMFCITQGSQGCTVWQNGISERYSGFPTKAIDTVGAGDAFAAGFLHGHANDWPISQTAKFANALGAIVASRAGAIPAWTVDECLQVIASNQGE
jgi:fructokinase